MNRVWAWWESTGTPKETFSMPPQPSLCPTPGARAEGVGSIALPNLVAPGPGGTAGAQEGWWGLPDQAAPAPWEMGD